MRRRFAPGWSRNSWGIGLFSNVWHREIASCRILRQCRGPWRGEVAARTTELALRVLEAPKLKADAERLEKAKAELSKEAARWRREAAGQEKVNDDVAQDVPAVKEEIADLKKFFWPASLSRTPDVVAAALAAVDAAPIGGCARHFLARHL